MQSAEPLRIQEHRRYELLDSLRGLVLVSMILFHTCWDLVYIFGIKWGWYKEAGAYIWQQRICWSFILLSGFRWPLGKRHLKRGLLVLSAGGVISLITVVFMPENRVIFGVLTMLGTCTLIMIPLERLFRRIPSLAGFAVMVLLFVGTKNVNRGYLGFEEWNFFRLPQFLYRGGFMTFLGFPEPGFYSTDYFSLFPWLFLFLSGYFIYRMMKGKKDLLQKYFVDGFKPFSFLGKHSLSIYMAHQPLIFGLLFGMREFNIF